MDIRFYKVGGAVRDQFLGVKSKDIDFAVEAPSYEAMREHIASHGKIFLESPEYFTIRAKMVGVDADFVLCRKDNGYSDGRRPDSVTVGDIYDDLSRRDFTMNAIAVDMKTGEFIDPHNGRADIESRFIRCVGNATSRFIEDSLRILRAIRFSITKDFRMSDDIHAALHNRSIVRLLENVSEDRIREEVNKCFRHDTYQTLLTFQHYPIVQEFVFENTNMWLEATNKSR